MDSTCNDVMRMLHDDKADSLRLSSCTKCGPITIRGDFSVDPFFSCYDGLSSFRLAPIHGEPAS